MAEEKKTRNLTDGLYTTPFSSNEKPSLIGSKCFSCGEVYFPKKEKNFCVHCQKETLKEVKLSRNGKISNFTIATQQPAGGFYKGPVPYAYGFVDLPEGVRVKTQFRCEFNDLRIGQGVEMFIGKLFEDDEGNDVLTYMFKPIK